MARLSKNHRTIQLATSLLSAAALKYAAVFLPNTLSSPILLEALLEFFNACRQMVLNIAKHMHSILATDPVVLLITSMELR